MRKTSSGFTIVEILVVIAVIGILTTISVISFARFQADSRDNQRTQRAGIIVEALEKYYDKNGEYPSCNAMTGSGTNVTTNVLTGIDPTVLVTPQASGQTNSILCITLTSSYPTDSFAYVGDGSVACSGSVSCLQFQLQYKQESTGTIQTINSRRNTNIKTSGSISDLSGTANPFSSINLTWSAVANSNGYTVQRSSTSSSFPSDGTLVSTTTGTNSLTAGSLTPGKTYYFRVLPNAASSQGNWSNTLTIATTHIGAPTSPTAADDGTNAISQLNFSWSAVANATSYTVNYSADSSFNTGVTTRAGLTGLSTSVTGLSAGTTLYFKVRAVAPDDTSSFTSPVNATTTVPPPTCTASNLASNTSINVYWNSVPNATKYNLQISTSSDFSAGGYIWNTTATTINASGLNNGTTYYFRVNTYMGTASSVWTVCPSATTGVDGPTSAGWSADAYGVRNTASVAWMPGAYPGSGTYWTNGMNIYGTCQPGATVVVRLYQYYAYSNNTTQNTSHLQDWTWNNQDLYVVGGRSTWMVWWQGWVACQVGGNRQGDTYLGNAGPY
jgi:prepilin-type N-terminal cleavage/methylation domain-containing protein